MKYHDPLYGEVELDALVADAVKRCPELKRLRYIGLMNFASLNMLGLTKISRLEHTIGLAYLAQLFCMENDYAEKNDMLMAALYHDVNCAPFGHTVEWAIERYVDYNHERKTDWIADEKSTSSLDKPLFIEPNGIHRYRFRERYNLSFDNIGSLIKGEGTFIINNNGIDLDNVDNVYRMGFHLGLPGCGRDEPVQLCKSLKIVNGYDNFVVSEESLRLVEHWHNLRTKIYRTFIYCREYLAFEYLLSTLISQYVAHHLSETTDIFRIWGLTDERLLFGFFEDCKKKLPKLSEIAKRLILLDLDEVYAVVRTPQFERRLELRDEELQSSVLEAAAAKVDQRTTSGRVRPSRLYLHTTTDDRKTERRVAVHVMCNGDGISPYSFGRDGRYIVIALLGKDKLRYRTSLALTRAVVEVLEEYGFGPVDAVPFSDATLDAQPSLFDRTNDE